MKYPIEIHINGELVFLNTLDDMDLSSIINELECKYSNQAFTVQTANNKTIE